jgi:Complex 1 protein (LYR family)
MSSSNGGRIILSQTARKRRPSSPLGSHIPSLSEFLHQQKVKSQYRQFLRAIRQRFPEKEDRNDAYNEVQSRYRQFQNETDPLIIRMAFQEGQRQVASLLPTSLSPLTLIENANNNGNHDNNNDDDDDKNSSDSWMNTKDSEDPRGRIGLQWPWEQTKNP